MFLGEHLYKIDAKGRVSVPSQFRAQGDGKYFVTYGPDRCLFVYDEAGFNKQVALLQKLEDANPRVRAMKRAFFSGPPLQECDTYGRIKIPAQFAAYAQIEKDLVLKGMDDHFEIWSQKVWSDQMQQDISNYYENYANMPDLVRQWPKPASPTTAANPGTNG